jgi:hypothetical protein
MLLVAWILVLTSTLATSPILAGPQQYVPGGPQTGPAYILDRLRQVLPGDWQVTAESGDRVPSRWRGAADAYYFRLEDTSTTIQHPDGFPYHPFIKLFFCPPHWSGRMEESDFYADLAPSLLLGKNHDHNVFYQTRGHLTWDDPWTALATTFDLTRPRVDRRMQCLIDASVRTRLAQRLATVQHDLPDDILGRVVGLSREGAFIYLEYSANVSFPPAEPGAPPLDDRVRDLVEHETQLLTEEIFSLFPDVNAIYVRRICDNRLFDTLVDRSPDDNAHGAANTRLEEPPPGISSTDDGI